MCDLQQIQDAADQGIMFSGFIQEPAGLHPRVTSRGGLGEASLSLHSSPSSLRCSELTASPSHQGESGTEDWAADGETEEPRTSRDAGADFVNMATFILGVLGVLVVLDRHYNNKPTSAIIILTGGDAFSDVMSTVSKSECCDGEQEDVPSPNNKAKDKEGNEKPSRPSLGKCGEDIICDVSVLLSV